MTGAIRALTISFWTILAATVGWVALSGWDYGFTTGLVGEGGTRLVMTLLLGLLVVSSGILLVHHRRSGGDEEYWTGGELVYALALLISLFYFMYSFFGWFFYD